MNASGGHSSTDRRHTTRGDALATTTSTESPSPRSRARDRVPPDTHLRRGGGGRGEPRRESTGSSPRTRPGTSILAPLGLAGWEVGARVGAALAALVCFVGGALIAGRLLPRSLARGAVGDGGDRGHARATGAARHGGRDLGDGGARRAGVRLGVTALLASGMGVQAATARRMAVPGLPTVVLTGVLLGLSVESPTRRLGTPEMGARGRQRVDDGPGRLAGAIRAPRLGRVRARRRDRCGGGRRRDRGRHDTAADRRGRSPLDPLGGDDAALVDGLTECRVVFAFRAA